MELWWSLLIMCQIYACLCEDPRRRLLDDLFGEKSGYRTELTPVKHPSETVQVKVSMGLHQIVELDEREQCIEIMVWLRIYWTDASLDWNPADYGNTTRIQVPPETVWRPDLVLYNSVERRRQDALPMPDTNIIVSSDGGVAWLGPSLLQSSCKIHVAEYPFDVQRCPLKFGCWTYNGLEVNITNLQDEATSDGFITNEAWQIVELPAARNELKYDCCPEPYPDITFTLVLRRKPMYYLFNLLVPCVLLIVLGIMVFLLPADSGEKLSLSITILLAMSVYQLIIMENIPRSSDEIPVLNQYFGAATLILSFSAMMSILVINVSSGAIRAVRAPHWLRDLMLDKLAKLLCMSKPTEISTSANLTICNVAGNEKPKNIELLEVARSSDLHAVELSGSYGTMEKILDEIRDFKQDADESGTIESEWKNIALVLDRILLIIFIIIFIGLTAGIFSKVASFSGSK